LREKAIELLTRGRYEELGELLSQLESATDDSGRTAKLRLLDVARAICRACSENQAAVAWHQEELSRIAGREQELNRGLTTVLDLIGGRAAESAQGRETPIQVSMLRAGPPEASASSMMDRLSPRQRVRSLTRWKASHGNEEARPTAGLSDATFGETEREARFSADMVIYCLGPFQVYFQDRLVEDWPNGKGKMIFKFLVNNRDRPVGKEILMDLLWPTFEPHAARNNLNVAIYSLRRAFAGISPFCSVVLFGSDCYFLNPDLDVWIDFEEFTDHLAAAHALERRGNLSLAMEKYHSAEVLYRGEFLEEDRYEDWPEPVRRRLRDDYLTLLDRLGECSLEQKKYSDCVGLCNKILAVDPCHEESHRRLMTCWSRQDLPHLAVRQYHICREALARELQFRPGEVTESLFERIRQRESV
jgi:DNA-binding SARP family transcriptional activator